MKFGRIAMGRQRIMQKIMEDPTREVAHYLPYIQSPKGKRIINLLGSKGNKGVALALLGSEVTVVDISASKKYANELADAAGVSIQYVVSDVLNVQLSESFDIVLLELGVLHYFLDLKPLFQKLLLYLSEMECLSFVTIILFTRNY